MQLLASLPAGSTVAIVFAAAAGIVGMIVTLLKLKPEANQSAVLQAQGAMETMAVLQDELEKALERERARSSRAIAAREQALAQFAELRDEHERIVDAWGPFPAGPGDA